MNKKIINVILCCYQGESFIAKQLDSVLAQTYPSIHIYIFDDCSTDQTSYIIAEYKKKYNNISVHHNDNNIGFLKNFENALRSTKGDYFALCDQDDIWHKDKLQLSMEALLRIESNDAITPILIHSDMTIIDEKEKLIDNSFFIKKGLTFSQEKSLSQILGHCGVMGNSILMNRQLVEKALPFPKQLKYHDYWLAIVNECFGKRETITKPLLDYRLHQKNTSNNNKQRNRSNKTLPFMQDQRALSIKYLLDNYSLLAEDRKLIEQFYSYLVLDGSRLSHFIFLLKNGFFKLSIVYRLNSFIRIMAASGSND